MLKSSDPAPPSDGALLLILLLTNQNQNQNNPPPNTTAILDTLAPRLTALGLESKNDHSTDRPQDKDKPETVALQKASGDL